MINIFHVRMNPVFLLMESYNNDTQYFFDVRIYPSAVIP